MAGGRLKDTGLVDCMKISGAFCALCIGAGFATGQEIMQFFASYGYFGLAGILLSFIPFLFMASEFLQAGKCLTQEQQRHIMVYYFGPKVGFVLDWFSVIFLYCVYIVMLAGSAAILSEYFGMAGMIGSAGMAICCLLVVLSGLQKIVDVLGLVGPVIVIFTLVVAIFNFSVSYENLSDVGRLLPTVTFTSASPFWWLSAILYPSFMFFTLAPVLPRIGSTAKNKSQAALGGVLGCFAYHIAIVAVVLAMLANLTVLQGKQVPMLTLAAQLSPAVAISFAFVILAGVFTTAAPLLYNTCARFTKEKTRTYTALAIILSIFAVFLGSILPFDTLVNTVYAYAGYAGAVLIAILILSKRIR